MKILIGCTGSVASIKAHAIVDRLVEKGYEVQIVATDSALHFLKNDETLNAKVWCDDDEWKMWGERGDPVLHIELRKWADIFLIAPLDANTLAKMAQGFCDNLLTCVVRAWDPTKPLFFCPAMNTFMWNHPLTDEHISKLKTFGYIEIPCTTKKLACGDTGTGAMAEVDTIMETLTSHCSS